jgi:multicomponent Na+:H+ antiporter subunit A
VLVLAALSAMGLLALLAPVLERCLGRNAGYPLAAGFIGVGVLLGTQAPTVLAGHPETASWPWIPALGISFSLRLDGLASLFTLLVLGVGALIMAYCPRYLPHGGRHGYFYFLLTLFGGVMLGLVLAADLVLLVVFWEGTTILSFLLISAAGSKGTRPAARALLITNLGGLALLAAVVLLAIITGTTSMASVLADPQRVLASPLAPAVAALLILAALTKSAQVPFNFWLPGAMVAITPVSAYLHAATMVKAGVYLLLRFSTLFAGQPRWSLPLMAAGLITAVLGAAQALREHDLKAILAYSTVSQLGLIVAAIGVGTTVALGAAILHTFAHALFKATLFMLVGIIDREAGSRDIRDLSGLMRVMPVTATLTGLAGLSLAGVPPMIGFVSKESLFQGFARADIFPGAGVVAGLLAVTASALTFAYGMRIFYDAFAGPTLQRRLYEPSWAFLAPAAVAAVAGLVLGPAVVVLDPLMREAIVNVEPGTVPPYFRLWHGLTPELLLSAITITCGMILFLLRDRVDRVLHRVPHLRGEGFSDKLQEATVRLGAAVGRPDHASAPWVYLVRPVAGLVVLGGVGVFTPGPLPPATGGRPVPGEWVVAALLAVTVAGLVRARSLVAAATLTGMTGLLVTVWFLLAGAPDVALTLLLAEVLTTMAAAFVLRGLPAAFPRARRREVLGAAIMAGLAGLSAGAATLGMAGRRGISPAGAFYLHAALPQAGAHNVVNAILVDFRGLDTLGEVSVLAAVALGLVLLLGGLEPAASTRTAAPYPLVLGPAYRVLAPVTVAASAYLFLRGHNEPGGGFSAALVAGITAGFGYLAGRGPTGARWRGTGPLLAAGLAVSVGVGLAAGVVGEPFLAHFPIPLPGGLSLSSTLLFDLGVYLIVLGLMVTVITRLTSESEPW